MTAEADRSWQRPDAATVWKHTRRLAQAGRDRVRRALSWAVEHLPFRHGFSSLTRRIVVLNLIGLAILVFGILYLNQFRAGLIDAKVQSLLTQGEIIARAIAASAGVGGDELQLDPEKLLEAEQGQTQSEYDTLPSPLEFTIDPERAVLLTAGEGEVGFFLLAAGEESTIDASELGPRIAHLLEGKGGGKDGVFQGRVNRLSNREAAVALLG